MSSFSNPFRSAAQMVAEGAIRRPADLEADGAVAAMTAAPRMHAAVERQQFQGGPEASAAAVATRAADQKKRMRSPDRVGRLLH